MKNILLLSTKQLGLLQFAFRPFLKKKPGGKGKGTGKNKMRTTRRVFRFNPALNPNLAKSDEFVDWASAYIARP